MPYRISMHHKSHKPQRTLTLSSASTNPHLLQKLRRLTMLGQKNSIRIPPRSPMPEKGSKKLELPGRFFLIQKRRNNLISMAKLALTLLAQVGSTPTQPGDLLAQAVSRDSVDRSVEISVLRICLMRLGVARLEEHGLERHHLEAQQSARISKPR